MFLTTIILALVKYNHFSRDREQLEDIYKIAELLPPGTITGSDSSLCADWGLAAYLNRVGYISFDCSNNHQYIIQESSQHAFDKAIFMPLDLKLKKYTLLRRTGPMVQPPTERQFTE